MTKEQIEQELREKIACLTCSVQFACGYRFGEVGKACKEQELKADQILSLLEPVELEALGDEEMEDIVPVFRYDKRWYKLVTQATIQKNQAKGQLFRVKE